MERHGVVPKMDRDSMIFEPENAGSVVGGVITVATVLSIKGAVAVVEEVEVGVMTLVAEVAILVGVLEVVAVVDIMIECVWIDRYS